MLQKEGTEEYRGVRCPLSDRLVDERATELAGKIDERSTLEQKRKDTAAAMKRDIEELSTDITGLAMEVRDRAETRQVRCRWERNDAAGLMELIRTDTSEVVSSRHLTDQERQLHLFADRHAAEVPA